MEVGVAFEAFGFISILDIVNGTIKYNTFGIGSEFYAKECGGTLVVIVGDGTFTYNAVAVANLLGRDYFYFAGYTTVAVVTDLGSRVFVEV